MENGLFVTEVKGDGYCFPKTVLKCLFLDHKYVMSFARFKRKITEHLIANFQKYTDYHTDSPDQLVYEATEFFNDRNFTTDVVDILVHATADALQLRMKIFRRSPAGNIQCEIIQVENPLMDIMLEFVTAGPGISATYTGANHYYAVTFVKPSSNLVPPTNCEEAANENPESVTEQIDEGSRVDNSDSETNEISEIPESNELVIDGIRGDSLVQSYLRPGTVFPTFLFKNVQPKLVTFLPPPTHQWKQVLASHLYRKGFNEKMSREKMVLHEDIITESFERCEESRDLYGELGMF